LAIARAHIPGPQFPLGWQKPQWGATFRDSQPFRDSGLLRCTIGCELARHPGYLSNSPPGKSRKNLARCSQGILNRERVISDRAASGPPRNIWASGVRKVNSGLARCGPVARLACKSVGVGLFRRPVQAPTLRSCPQGTWQICPNLLIILGFIQTSPLGCPPALAAPDAWAVATAAISLEKHVRGVRFYDTHGGSVSLSNWSGCLLTT
jgi:hypothetical protein